MTTLKRLIAYGLLCSLPALLGGCWGKCTDRLLSADKRAYFMDFKPGDYWIYRNVQNGDIDSVYFVSQEVRSENKTPTCLNEDAIIQLKGFAKSLTYSYVVQGWDGVMKTNVQSTVDYYGNYDVATQKPTKAAGRNYAQTVSTTHCCIEGCITEFCDGITLRFDRLVFAKSVGIVRWEAIRHPKFGTVTYELIRSNRL